MHTPRRNTCKTKRSNACTVSFYIDSSIKYNRFILIEYNIFLEF